MQAAWEENQNSKDGEMAVSPVPLCVSVSPGLTPTRLGTDMDCGARAPRRSPLVMLQGPRWGPWHSGCVWGSPQHCSISPPSSQAPDLDSVSSGGRSGRDGRGHPWEPTDRGLPTQPQALETQRRGVSSTACLQETHFK